MRDAISREQLREIFRQIVLTLGGVFSLYQPEDELVWSIVRHLDQVFENHIEPDPPPAGAPEDRDGSKPRVHPAVVELLANIDRRAPNSRASAPGKGR